MSNNIKNKLKGRFDKDNNYSQILSKVERKNNIWFKYSLAPICLAVIVGIIFFVGDNTKTLTPDSDNIIVINERADRIGMERLLLASIEGCENSEEFSFVNDLKVPGDLLLSSKYTLYFPNLPEDFKTEEGWATEWQKDPFSSPYTELGDYVLIFVDDIEEIDYRSIRIAFSEKGSPARCYWFMDANLKESTINNTQLIITKYEDFYWTVFKLNDLYFDIETKGITENELIQLLESILK